jgi:hypothetical protein
MSTVTPINLGYGVQLHADHASDGWRAVELTALGNLAGSVKRLHLSPPPELAGRRFVSSEELARATLSWLYTPRGGGADRPSTAATAKTSR